MQLLHMMLQQHVHERAAPAAALQSSKHRHNVIPRTPGGKSNGSYKRTFQINNHVAIPCNKLPPREQLQGLRRQRRGGGSIKRARKQRNECVSNDGQVLRHEIKRVLLCNHRHYAQSPPCVQLRSAVERAGQALGTAGGGRGTMLG